MLDQSVVIVIFCFYSLANLCACIKTVFLVIDIELLNLGYVDVDIELAIFSNSQSRLLGTLYHQVWSPQLY